MKTIAFRVDSSHVIGTGHVMRCLSLADELKALGYECLFVVYPHAPTSAAAIINASFRVLELPSVPFRAHTSLISSEWLMTTEEDDAFQFLKLVPKKCELVIVDHYAIGSRWHNVIRTNFPVLAIDDLGDRSMAPDILLNYNLNDGTHERYKSLISEHTHLWLGTKFLLLRSEYIKEVSAGARIRKNFGNVFVFMGGADSQNYTDQFLELLIELFGNSKSIKVIVGTSNPHKKALLDKYSKYPFVDILAPRQSIIDLLNWADLAIGAFGSTAYERAAVALPSVGLILAENQRTIGQTFADLGLAWAIDSNSRDLKQQAAKLLKSINVEKIHKQSRDLKQNFRVDGGAKMVAQHVQAFINKTDTQCS